MKITEALTFYATYKNERPNHKLTILVSDNEYVDLIKLTTMFEGGQIDLPQVIYEFKKQFEAKPVSVESSDAYEDGYNEGIAWERKRWEILYEIEQECKCNNKTFHLQNRANRSENGIDYDKEFGDVG